MQWGLWLDLWPLAEELSWAAVPAPLSLSLAPTLLTVCPAGLLVETSAPHVTVGAGTMRQPHCRGVPTCRMLPQQQQLPLYLSVPNGQKSRKGSAGLA